MINDSALAQIAHPHNYNSEEIKLLMTGQAKKLFRVRRGANISPIPGINLKDIDLIDPEFPSILIFSMRRSGSTFLKNSFINSFGYIDLPYSYVAHGDDALTFKAGWLAMNGFIARVHSQASERILTAIETIRPGRLIFTYRNPVNAAFSVFVRHFYNPRRIDRVSEADILEITQMTDRKVFDDFMGEEIRKNLEFLNSWNSKMHLLKQEPIILKYGSFYEDELANIEALSRQLQLGKPLKPAEKNIRSNWQSPITEKLRETYQPWLDELEERTPFPELTPKAA